MKTQRTWIAAALVLASLLAARPADARRATAAGAATTAQERFGRGATAYLERKPELVAAWQQANPTFRQMRNGIVPAVLGVERVGAKRGELQLMVSVGLRSLFGGELAAGYKKFTVERVPVTVSGNSLREMAQLIRAIPLAPRNTAGIHFRGTR